MSILSRLVNLFRYKSHSALDRMEDPGAAARLKAKDYATEVAKFEEQLTAVLTEEKVLQKRGATAADNVELWLEKARAAVRGGNDSLAKEALTRKSAADAQLAALQQSLSKIQLTTGALKQRLERLRHAKAEAQTQAEIIDARSKAAAATEHSIRLLNSVGTGPKLSFEDLQNEVSHREARAEALHELVEASPDNLEQQFAQLEAPSLDGQLAALKAEVLHATGTTAG